MYINSSGFYPDDKTVEDSAVKGCTVYAFCGRKTEVSMVDDLENNQKKNKK